MMRDGRDEERRKGDGGVVMFPRLHVNDREQGGPRAPPRNKMALYEQYTVPLSSQRSTCGFASSSSNGGGGLQNSTSTPLYNFRAVGHPAVRQEAPSSVGVGLNKKVETNQPSQSSSTKLPPPPTACQPQTSNSARALRRKLDCSEDMTVPQLRSSKGSSHKVHRTEPRLQLRSLELIDLEPGQVVDVPSPKIPKLRKSAPPTLTPPMKDAESPLGLERPQESVSRMQLDLSAIHDATSGGDRVLSTAPLKEGRKGSHGEVEHESVSASSSLSPNDIEKIIGPTKFWKARRALVNQQRVFAVQLFELHRIIKVQNLISRSPDILSEESLGFRNSTVEVSPSEFLPETKLDSENNEDAAGNPPIHNGKIEMPSKPLALQPVQRSISENLQEPENTIEPGMQCFPPVENQWLVPFVSPSEGLIYKPYAGPGPPDTGIPGSICGPIKFDLGCRREYLNATMVGLPPVSTSYFPPYGMPLANSPMPSQTHEQENSIQWSNTKQPPEQVGQVEGSTTSSPWERPREETALPLFPTSAAPEQDSSHGSTRKKAKVIKVVPRNSKSASEAAARIFRLIQEERRQLTSG